MSAARQILARAADELAIALEPLVACSRDPQALYELLLGFGWSLEGLAASDLAAFRAALASVDDAVALAHAACDRPTDAEAAEALRSALDLVRATTEALHASLLESAEVAAAVDAGEELGVDLVEHLAVRYLYRRAPMVAQLAQILGVVRRDRPAEIRSVDGATVLRYPLPRLGFNRAALDALTRDPLAQGLLATITPSGGAPRTAAELVEDVQTNLVSALGRLAVVLGEESLRDRVVRVDASGARVSPRPVALNPGGPVELPLPIERAPTLLVTDADLQIAWAEATVATQELVLFEEGGVSFAVAEVGAEGCPARELVAGMAGGRLSMTLWGGIVVRLPLGAITTADGDTVSGLACATLDVAQGAPPSLTFDVLQIGPAAFHLGGADGIRIVDATLRMEGLALPFADPVPPVHLSARGTVALGDSTFGARAAYDVGERAFGLSATASVHLGDGIWLEPVDDDTPVLRLTATPDAQTGEVHALFRVPQEAVGLTAVRVDGTIGVRMGSDGRLEVTSLSAESAVQGDWALPGGVHVGNARVGIAYDGTRFTGTLGGTLSLPQLPGDAFQGSLAFQATISATADDPEDVRVDAELSNVRMALLDELRVLDGRLAVAIRTKPAPGEVPAHVQLREASGGLLARSTPAPATLDGYYLALEGAEADFAFHAGGADLTFSAGRVLLPREFSADPGTDGSVRPSIAIADAQEPLVVGYSAPAQLHFGGRLRFQDFGVRIPVDAGDPLVAQLTSADLHFSSSALPELSGGSGYLDAPLPDGQRARLDFTDIGWDLRGLPVGRIALGAPIRVDIGGDFALELLDDSTSATGTGLTVARIPDPAGSGGEYHQFTFSAAVRLEFPEAVLSSSSAEVHTDAAGSLILSTAPDALPRLQLDELGVGGDFRLGGPEGLELKGADIRAEGIANVFDRSVDEAHAFALSVSGEVIFPDGGPELELEDARFTFTSSDLRQPPRFTVGAMTVRSGRILEGLPISVHEAGLDFVDETLPMPRLVQTDSDGNSNLVITCGVGLDLDMGAAGVMGRMDAVTATIRHGLPQISIGGIGFGVENFTVSTMTLSGIVYLGGLEHMFRLPPDPTQLFFAGKLGGTVSGTGVTALLAVKLAPPMLLGVCFQLSGGSAGIPLGQTGILLTGAAGGVSFTNTNGSPCDFTTYVQLGPDGKPLPLPTDETGAPVTVPPSATSGPVEKKTRKEKPFEFPGCPCGCPPPSMNVFCQPHPDQEQFPGRVVLKFSSLDQEMMDGIMLPVLGGDPVPLHSWIDDLGVPTPEEAGEMANHISQSFTGAAVEQVVRLWPGGAAELPPDFDDKVEVIRAELSNRLRQGLDSLDGRTVWQMMCDEAYKGLPCPDATIQVTATFSYTGVSSFLSVTGGVSLSTTGAVGVIGWLNLVGIPIGRLNAFLVATSATGEIDPAICGELQCSIGPLDIGKVNVELSCRGFITGVRNALVGAVGQLAGPVVREIFLAVDEKLGERPDLDSDPEQVVAELHADKLTAFVEQVALRARSQAPDAATFQTVMRNIVVDTYDAFDPLVVMCGKLHLKIFGIPLGSELIAGNAWANTTGMGGSLAFSPIYLVVGGINAATATTAAFFCGMEQAVLGFTVKFPDVLGLAVDAITGDVATPEQLRGYLEHGFDTILNRSTMIASYRLAPMGLTLTSCGARVVLPDLVDHPVLRDPPWQRPEDRGLPSRPELLQRVLRAAKLTDAFWDGALDPFGLPGLRLRDDYFPHGGIIGAAFLDVPRALAAAPPVELLDTIFNGADTLERLQAGLTYVKDYLAATENMGTLGFYVPAPSPPTVTADGRPLDPEAMLRVLSDPAYARELTGTDPSPNVDKAFLVGLLEGRLFGVPVVNAVASFVPPPENDPDAEAVLAITAETPEDSWPARLGLRTGLAFRITQCPPTPIATHVEALMRALGTPFDGSGNPLPPVGDALQAAIAAAPRTPADVLALFDAVVQRAVGQANEMAEEVKQLPYLIGAHDPEYRAPDYVPFDTEARAGQELERAAHIEAKLGDLRATLELLQADVAEAEAGASPGERAGAVANVLVQHLLRTLRSDLPRVSLEASFSLDVAAIADYLTADAAMTASVAAFSPAYDPVSTGSGALGMARREGGVVLSGAFRVGFRMGGHALSLELPPATYALVPPGVPTDPPRLHGDVQIGELELPLRGSTLALSNARASFDTQPADGTTVLTIRAEADPIRLGRFLVQPAGAAPAVLGVTVLVRKTADGLAAELHVDPARLSVPALSSGSSLLIHGADPTDPFRLGTDGSLSAGLSLSQEGDLLIESPYDPTDPPLVRVPAAAVTAAITSSTATATRVELGASAGAGIEVLPSVLDGSLAGGSFLFWAKSTGTFGLTLSVAPIEFAAFKLHGDVPDPAKADEIDTRLELALSHYGFRVSGARLRIEGVTARSLRLRKFVMNGNGDFSVTSTMRTLDVAGFFHFSSAGIRLVREAGDARLLVRTPRITLLPDTPMEATVLPGATLEVASSGAFHVEAVTDASAPLFAVPGQFAVSGRLAAGFAPLSQGGQGPFARITDATLKVHVLPGDPELHASEVELSPARVTADVELPGFGIPGIATVSASAWSFEYLVGGHVVLRASAPSVTLFESFTFTGPSLDLRADVGGAHFHTDSVPLVPGLLELRDGDWSVDRNAGTAAFSGGIVVLGRTLLNTTARFSVAGNDVKLSLSTPIAIASLGSALRVQIPTQTFTLVRQGGAFGLKAHFGVDLLGSSATATALVTSTGSLSLAVSDVRLGFGPFTLATDGDSTITCNALDALAPVAADVPGGTLQVRQGYALAGWPSSLSLPGFSLTSDGSFSVDAGTLSFHGIPLTPEGPDRYARLSRDMEGKVSVSVRNSVDFLGSALALRLDVSDGGVVTGNVRGTVKLSFGGILASLGEITFADLELGYTGNAEYPFSTTRSALGYTFWFGFGGTGAKACRYEVDENGNVELTLCRW
ncbi:MAG: hypothetical protein AMXMBFR53_25690 [Gemmatimonadota bacterium]